MSSSHFLYVLIKIGKVTEVKLMGNYNRNHYVPKWYQYRFFPIGTKENNFYYLDLQPNSRCSNGYKYKDKTLRFLGPDKCFFQENLYTTKFGSWKSTEIEEKFFGKIDSYGKEAIEYLSTFNHKNINSNLLRDLLKFMSAQKLRTPKGLKFLSKDVKLEDKNEVLFKMQELQEIFCAIWSECVWSIVDASQSQTKFILSDHPVTVYNQDCFPLSNWCVGHNDPDIRYNGTYTIFPLSLDKLLIFTNLSWLRNPHAKSCKMRPNSNLFRDTIFNVQDIQVDRILDDSEVNQINYILKRRAYKYIAAPMKEWLFPEEKIGKPKWDQLGKDYLLMPDPRLVTFSSEIIIGYNDRRADIFDEYGRKPGQLNYNNRNQSEQEFDTFNKFKVEFTKKFGPKSRGRTGRYHLLCR